MNPTRNAFELLMRHHIQPKNLVIVSDPLYKMMFDGGSRGNPGLCGAGAVIYKDNREIASVSHFIPGKHTNNYAEYTAFIMGMEKAHQLNIKSLSVEGDSKLVINQCLGIWKVKSSALIDLNSQAKSLMNNFEYIKLNHVFRHYNKRADQLANIAMDTQSNLY
jgi:ribonuclease HI